MTEFARVKVDIWEHPKFTRLTLEAKALWLRGLLYAVRTDSEIIPEEVLTNESANATIYAAELVDAGLWHYGERGWHIHDYFDWNPRAQPSDPAARRRDLAAAVRRGAGIAESDWSPNYEAGISHSAIASTITPAEVEEITRWLIDQWARKKEPITGVPRFQTILNARTQYQMARNRPQRVSNYLIRTLAYEQGTNESDTRPAGRVLAPGGSPGAD